MRFLKIVLLIPIFLSEFFNFITDLGNTDSTINSVKQIISFPTTENTHVLLDRTISFPNAANIITYSLAGLHIIVALILLFAILKMLKNIKADDSVYNNSNAWAVAGCTFAYVQYTLLYGAIGGDWFLSWMQPNMTTLKDAFSYSLPIGIVLIVMLINNQKNTK